mmetsp:Transcript_30602/g.27799  ORF Transcript_30602/g.27799 Transcript_30602/m.27799 type:complete len:203 (+) Transcript_30602:408-1016(+)
MSAFAAIAEYPSRLLKCFKTKKGNQLGFYCVRIFKDGKPLDVVVDDYIPVDHHNKAIFTRPRDSELWPTMLEKAYTKYCGSYQDMALENCAEVLETVTSAPTDFLFHKDYDMLTVWEKLKDYAKSNYIMTGICGYNKSKMVAHHGYAIVNVYEFPSLKLVKLRDSWSSKQWKEIIGKLSVRWTKELKRAVHFHADEKGAIYM